MLMRQPLKILEVHPGPGCQLDCAFCYRRGKTYRYGGSLLSIRRLRTLIEEFAAQGGRQLNVSGGLEPFTRLQAVTAAVQSAHAQSLRTWVYTNGTCAALDNAETLTILVRNTDRIRFSIHAMSERIYRLVVRPQGPSITLARVREVVRHVLQAKSASSPEVGIDFVVTPDNAPELVDAAIQWRSMGADFLDVRFDVTDAQEPGRPITWAVEQLRQLMNANRLKPLRVDIGTYAQRKRFAPRCWAPGQKLVVDPFGLAWPCCMLAHPGIRPRAACLGDVRTSPLGDIVQAVQKRYPRPHCPTCTPGEATYNLRQEAHAAREARVCPKTAPAAQR